MDIFSSFFSGDWYWYLEVVLCKPIDMFVFHSLVNVFDVLFTGEWSYSQCPFVYSYFFDSIDCVVGLFI